MKYSLGWALVIAGMVLVVMGIYSADSLASTFSRMFTGSPTDKAAWLLVGGLGISAMGGTLLNQQSN